jgi:hypothetical protein
MKVFYKSISNAKEVLEKNSFSHEELLFPDNVFEALRHALEESRGLLPESARKFQEWNVGLLERFGRIDLEGLDVSVGITPERVEGGDTANEENNKGAPDKGEPAIEDIPNSEALLV